MARAVIATALLVLLVACDPPARQAVSNPLATATEPTTEVDAPTGSTLRFGITEPGAIVPPLARAVEDFLVTDALFDSLTRLDASGAGAPSAASSWTVNEAATVWSFQLPDGATFHDGTRVTANSFIEAWNVLAARGAMTHLLRDVAGYDAVVRGDVEVLSGLSAPTPLTLEVSLLRPRSDFAEVVSHPALGPVQHSAYAETPAAYSDQPIGNGPFRMDEPWAHGDFIRTGRFDGWTLGPQPTDAVGEVLFLIADLDTNFLAFRQGRVDVTTVPPEALELAAEEHPPQGSAYAGPGLITGPVPVTYAFAINQQVPPYEDEAVREAASLIINRELIAERNAGGNLDAATSLLPPALSPASEGMCELCTFNPTGAAGRLEDAGVDSLSLAFNADGGHEPIRDVIRDALAEEGFGLVSNRRGAAPTFPEYLQRLTDGNVGMYRLTLTADVPSSLELLYPLLHSSQVPESGGLNYLRYNDPTVDSLLEQAARTLDAENRESLLRRVEDIVVNRDHVLNPVITYRHSLVVADGVDNLRVDPFGWVNLSEVRVTLS